MNGYICEEGRRHDFGEVCRCLEYRLMRENSALLKEVKALRSWRERALPILGDVYVGCDELSDRAAELLADELVTSIQELKAAKGE